MRYTNLLTYLLAYSTLRSLSIKEKNEMSRFSISKDKECPNI